MTLRAEENLTLVASADLAETAFGLARRPEIGGVLIVHAPQGLADEAAIASLCHPPADLRAPLLVCAMGESTGRLHRSSLARSGLAAFATPDQAVQGFDYLLRDRRNREAARELPPSTVLHLAPEREMVRRCFDRVREGGCLTLAQDESLDVLAAYGIPKVPTRFAASAQDAVAAAALLGFPVVVKLRDSGVPADRPPGSLILDLHDAAQVAAAAELLLTRSKRQDMPGELLVQRYAGRSREVAVRVADDRLFGPMIRFGGGGTSPHPADKAVDLPPLNLPLAKGLVRRCRSGAMLGRSLRDYGPANADAMAQTLVRISQLIVDFPEIAVLDVPSMFVDAEGVSVADAWLRLRGADEPPARLAIAPYPVELVERRRIGSRSIGHPANPAGGCGRT